MPQAYDLGKQQRQIEIEIGEREGLISRGKDSDSLNFIREDNKEWFNVWTLYDSTCIGYYHVAKSPEERQRILTLRAQVDPNWNRISFYGQYLIEGVYLIFAYDPVDGLFLRAQPERMNLRKKKK